MLPRSSGNSVIRLSAAFKQLTPRSRVNVELISPRSCHPSKASVPSLSKLGVQSCGLLLYIRERPIMGLPDGLGDKY